MSLALFKKKATAGRVGKNFKPNTTKNYGTRYVINKNKQCNASPCCPNTTQKCKVFKKFKKESNNKITTQSSGEFLYNKINTQLKKRFNCVPECNDNNNKIKKPLIRSYDTFLRYKKAGVGARETDWSNQNKCCN